MKPNKTICAIFLAMGLMLFYSCGGDVAGDVERTADGRAVISFSGSLKRPEVRSMDAEEGPETRIYISDDIDPRFDYTDNTTPETWFLFKQGTATKAVKGVITIDKDKLTYRASIPAPQGFDPSNGAQPLYVAAAFGVDSMDDNGNVAITPPEKIAPSTATGSNGRVSYRIPICFPLTRVAHDGFLTASFQLFGALLRFELSATSRYYKPNHLFVKSDAFHMAGSMNLNSESAPAWTPDAAADALGHTIAIDGIELRPTDAAHRFLYVWMKPSATPQANVQLGFADHDNKGTGINRAPQVEFREGLSHRLSLVFDMETYSPYRMTFTTSRAVGSTVSLNLGRLVTSSETEFTWIDLNNNGVRDSGEDLANLTTSTSLAASYTLGAQTVTIYGQMRYFAGQTIGMTSIDVSRQNALTNLLVANNNLTSLDVTKNTALDVLYANGNQLTTIDLSQNTKLTYLNITTTAISSIDLSHNTELTTLQSVSNTQLKVLDLTHNTKLRRLECRQGALEQLLVSNNAGALAIIYCERNQLKDTNMTAFMESLPVTNGGTLRIYRSGTPLDGNVALTSDVAIATAKGWSVTDFAGSPYAGQ